MKCPKCGYTSFDYLDSCKKCQHDLVEFKARYGLRSLIFPPSKGGAATTLPDVDRPDELLSADALASAEPLGFGYDFMEAEPGDAPAADGAREEEFPSEDAELAVPAAPQEFSVDTKDTDFSFDLAWGDETPDEVDLEAEPPADPAEDLDWETAEPAPDDLAFDLDHETLAADSGAEPFSPVADTDSDEAAALPPVEELEEWSVADAEAETGVQDAASAVEDLWFEEAEEPLPLAETAPDPEARASVGEDAAELAALLESTEDALIVETEEEFSPLEPDAAVDGDSAAAEEQTLVAAEAEDDLLLAEDAEPAEAEDAELAALLESAEDALTLEGEEEFSVLEADAAVDGDSAAAEEQTLAQMLAAAEAEDDLLLTEDAEPVEGEAEELAALLESAEAELTLEEDDDFPVLEPDAAVDGDSAAAEEQTLAQMLAAAEAEDDLLLTEDAELAEAEDAELVALLAATEEELRVDEEPTEAEDASDRPETEDPRSEMPDEDPKKTAQLAALLAAAEDDLLPVDDDETGDDPDPEDDEAAATEEEAAGSEAAAEEEAETPLTRSIASRPATLLERSKAVLFDLLLLGLVFLLFLGVGKWALFPATQGWLPEPQLLTDLLIPYFLLFFGVVFGYFTLFHFLAGQTPGKMLLRLKVEGESGAPLSLPQSFLRSAGGLLSLMTLGLGYLTIALNRRQRGWNDLFAGTRVMRALTELPPEQM